MNARWIAPNAQRQVTLVALFLVACATQAEIEGTFSSSGGGGSASGGSGASMSGTTGGAAPAGGNNPGTGATTSGGTGGSLASAGSTAMGGGGATNGGGAGGSGGGATGGFTGLGGSGGVGSSCDAQVSGGEGVCECVVGPTHEYIFCDREKNVSSANSNCTHASVSGFRLVAINNEEENAWIVEQAQTYFPADSQFWTNGRQIGSGWKWADETGGSWARGTFFWPVGYANWKGGTAPSEGDCVTVHTDEGTWTTADSCSDDRLPYVCERG